jgi:hypothetical protein
VTTGGSLPLYMKATRPLILVAILAAIVGLAFLVARPSAEPPAATPYVGQRGASRAKASGLAVSVRRDGEVDARPLAPGTLVRPGDVLRFAVRAERPRHLLVRLRDGAAPATTVFPAAGAAASLVQPGETLPVTPVLAPGAGKVIVTAVFADHPFSLDAAAAADTEEIDLVIQKEPESKEAAP